MTDISAHVPTSNLGWNTYGMGLDAVGRDGAPEPIAVPDMAPDQMLVRVDAVGLCFSDVKLIRLGGDHPKLYGRDLSVEPTRLGHEASVTVIAVGDELADTYSPGERLAIQPDIHVDGVSTAYGYTIPGGLIQYHLIGSEVLEGDEGAYVIPVTDELGYASAALSEPWACVEAAYTQRRRLDPLDGGTRWVIADPVNDTAYDFGGSLSAAGSIVVTGASESMQAQITAAAGDVAVNFEDEIAPADVAAFGARHTGQTGFDDIIMLAPTSAVLVTEVAKLIAFRGTMNLVGTEPLDGDPDIDFGRLHYHYTAYVGTDSPAIETAYGEDRNRADLRPGGVAAFVGAAGPMGQMHIQRSIEMADGPDTLVCIDPDKDRMAVLVSTLQPLADAKGKTMVIVDPTADDARSVIDGLTDGRGADDVVVSVPVAPVMADAGRLMATDGMLVFFAGIANGTFGPLDMSQVYLSNAQFTGTSGSSVADQASVLAKAMEGSLSPSLNLAAIGGIEAGRDGIQAVMEGRFAGKVLIFPQVTGVPLTGLGELADVVPDVAAELGPNGEWTDAAERVLHANHGVAAP
ncbi:MAG: alcohol dehydrogenase catalytic domain-containing protein [Actinomycetota bacterium]